MRGCVGASGRIIRVLIGVIALGVGLTQPGSIGQSWAFVTDAAGLIALVTGLVGRCPLYALIGLRTCKTV